MKYIILYFIIVILRKIKSLMYFHKKNQIQKLYNLYGSM